MTLSHYLYCVNDSVTFCQHTCILIHCVYVVENERRVEEQLQDMSSVTVELRDKRIKVNELEASCS